MLSECSLEEASDALFDTLLREENKNTFISSNSKVQAEEKQSSKNSTECRKM